MNNKKSGKSYPQFLWITLWETCRKTPITSKNKGRPLNCSFFIQFTINHYKSLAYKTFLNHFTRFIWQISFFFIKLQLLCKTYRGLTLISLDKKQVYH